MDTKDIPVTEPRLDRVWQSPDIARRFVNGMRRAIPGGDLQLEVMLRLVESIGRPVQRFLDLGCGSGTLGAVVLQRYPEAAGTFVDFSAPMIDTARKHLAHNPNLAFHVLDYADPAWTETVADRAPFDAVVSGFSIHHQPDENKVRIYREVFDLLASGGVFVNVEHVQPTSDRGQALFVDHFVENLYALERSNQGPRTRDQIRAEFVNREDAQANILSPVDAQLDWMRDIGYSEVDCHLKIYELAVMGGRRPE